MAEQKSTSPTTIEQDYCPRCYGSGLVVLVVENDEGEFQDILVPCRRCNGEGA